MIGIYLSLSAIATMLYLIPAMPPPCTEEAERITSAIGVDSAHVEAGEESYMITLYLSDGYVIMTSFSPTWRVHMWYRSHCFEEMGSCTGPEDVIYHIGQRTDTKELN